MLWSPVKAKVTAALGPKWSTRTLAAEIGCHRTALTRALAFTGAAGCPARHTLEVQDALAQRLGMSTADLFGEHAWFKLAAAGLLKRRVG